MNKNIQIYWNAAKEQPALLSSDEVRNIIVSGKSAALKKRFSEKWFYMSAAAFAVIVLWFTLTPEKIKQTAVVEVKQEDNAVEKTLIETQKEKTVKDHKNLSTLRLSFGSTQKAENAKSYAVPTALNNREEKKTTAQETYFSVNPLRAENSLLLHTPEPENNYFNEDGYLILNYEELKGLGIITDGNTLSYFNRTDSTYTHVNWYAEKEKQTKRKTPIFKVEISKHGSIRTLQSITDDTIKPLQTKDFHPVAFETWSEKEKRSKDDLMVVGLTHRSDYDFEYFNEIKSNLVPVHIALKARIGIYSTDRYVIFWFKNESDFINALPSDAANAVARKFGQPKSEIYFSNVRRKYTALVEQRKNDLESLSIQGLQKNYIIPNDVTLEKLGIERTNKWVKFFYYQLDSNKARTKGFYTKFHYKSSQIYTSYTANGFSRGSKKKAEEINKLRPIAISNYKLSDMDFLKADFEIANAIYDHKQYEYFKQIANDLYPVFIDSNHVFWFRKNEEIYKIIQQDKYQKAGVNIRQINKLSLSEDELKELGIEYAEKGIRVPQIIQANASVYSVYNNEESFHEFKNVQQLLKQSSFSSGGVPPTYKNADTTTRKEPIKYIIKSEQLRMDKQGKSINLIPSPVLITTLDGIGWRSYLLETENYQSKADEDSMNRNNISLRNFQPYIDATEKAKADLLNQIKTLLPIQIIHPTLKNTGIIAWYKLDSTLLNALSPRIAQDISNEATAIRNKQQPAQCTYFEACTELTVSYQAQIFPNPASNELNIELETPQDNEFNICITNINGKVIKTLEQKKQLFKAKHALSYDISSLSAGMYLVQISNSNQELITRRLIKK